MTPASRLRKSARLTTAAAWLGACIGLWVAGCGAPGDPTPPSPPIPVAVTDLFAQQSGDGVALVFTPPDKTVKAERLTSPPAVEILRGLPRADGSPDAKSLRVVLTIPGSLLANYVSEGRVKLTDPVAPAEIAGRPGGSFVYGVRTRASQKRASADSNLVLVPMFPVPERIMTLAARVTEPAVELSWTAPEHTSAGQPLGTLSGYHIYRGELDPSSGEAAQRDLAQVRWKSPLELLASSQDTNYRDALFDFGKTYAYLVRSTVLVEGKPLESSDSNSVVLTPRDTFPPGTPQNLVANVAPGSTPDSLVVDLSWSSNLETDLAGYRVYRSVEQGTKGVLITPELLLVPAYRDNSVEPGHRYWYRVTAVDRAGNESGPGAPLAVDMAKPSL